MINDNRTTACRIRMTIDILPSERMGATPASSPGDHLPSKCPSLSPPRWMKVQGSFLVSPNDGRGLNPRVRRELSRLSSTFQAKSSGGAIPVGRREGVELIQPSMLAPRQSLHTMVLSEFSRLKSTRGRFPADSLVTEVANCKHWIGPASRGALTKTAQRHSPRRRSCRRVLR